jgi:hypothetical protein
MQKKKSYTCCAIGRNTHCLHRQFARRCYHKKKSFKKKVLYMLCHCGRNAHYLHRQFARRCYHNDANVTWSPGSLTSQEQLKSRDQKSHCLACVKKKKVTWSLGSLTSQEQLSNASAKVAFVVYRQESGVLLGNYMLFLFIFIGKKVAFF